MRDVLRGLYDGGGTLAPVKGIVEIGIACDADWCSGGDVAGAAFDPRWATFDSWD